MSSPRAPASPCGSLLCCPVLSRSLDSSFAPDVRAAITPITLAKLGANSAYRFAPPFLATVAADLHVTLPTIGVALAVGELGGLSAPLIGRITARVTRRAAICGGLVGVAVAALVCAVSQNIVQLGIGLAMLTMAKLLFDIGVASWIADRVPYAQRGRVIGVTELAWAASLLIGVVLMGLITGAFSWRWGYAAAVVAIVILAAVLRTRLPDEPPTTRTTRTTEHVAAPLGNGWWIVIATFSLMAAAQSVFVTFGTWLKDDFGYSDTRLTTIIFGFGAVELLATSTMIRFADGWGKQRSALIGASLMVPSGVGLAIASNHVLVALPLLATFVGCFEFALVSTLPLASVLVPGHPARGLGFIVGAGTLGRASMSAPAAAALSSHGMWLPASLGAACALGATTSQWRYRVSLCSHS